MRVYGPFKELSFWGLVGNASYRDGLPVPFSLLTTS